MSHSQDPVTQTDFYVRWHDEGSTQGVWEGSIDGHFDASHTVDSFTLAAGQHTLRLSTHQGGGGAYEVFATIEDGGTCYGARISPTNDPQCDLGPLSPSQTLLLTAGRLISDDPKIKISTSPEKPSICTLTWDGRGWTYQYPGGAAQSYDCHADPIVPIEMSPSGGAVTVNVIDETATTTDSHTCAVSYAKVGSAPAAPGARVALVQSQTTLTNSRPTAITIAPPTNEPWQCTINLYAALASGTGRLAVAPPTS